MIAEDAKLIAVVNGWFMVTMAFSRGGDMSSHTKYISRLLGFYSVLVALAMISHRQETVGMLSRLTNHAGAPVVIGLLAFAVGLAIVLGHNKWSGGALPVVITLIGWWSMAKGMLCLFLPLSVFDKVLNGPLYKQYFYVTPAISLLLGFYLIFASYSGKADGATAK